VAIVPGLTKEPEVNEKILSVRHWGGGTKKSEIGKGLPLIIITVSTTQVELFNPRDTFIVSPKELVLKLATEGFPLVKVNALGGFIVDVVHKYVSAPETEIVTF